MLHQTSGRIHNKNVSTHLIGNIKRGGAGRGGAGGAGVKGEGRYSLAFRVSFFRSFYRPSLCARRPQPQERRFGPLCPLHPGW